MWPHRTIYTSYTHAHHIIDTYTPPWPPPPTTPLPPKWKNQWGEKNRQKLAAGHAWLRGLGSFQVPDQHSQPPKLRDRAEGCLSLYIWVQHTYPGWSFYLFEMNRRSLSKDNWILDKRIKRAWISSVCSSVYLIDNGELDVSILYMHLCAHGCLTLHDTCLIVGSGTGVHLLQSLHSLRTGVVTQ